MKRLPYIDEHATTVAADIAATWAALPAVPIGFTLDEAVPHQRFALRGRHWFSSYRLVFVLTDISHDPVHPRTRVVAETWASFPGLKGRTYRALVIGTRAHRIVVRHMLKGIVAKADSHTFATA